MNIVGAVLDGVVKHGETVPISGIPRCLCRGVLGLIAGHLDRLAIRRDPAMTR